MNQQKIQEEILSCVWSDDLKNYIKEHNYIFSSTELLSIAYHFAPTYNERLRLLQLLVDYAPDVSEFAIQCIRFQNDCLEQFFQHGDNEVYELRIKDDPDAYEERYLCANYQTALDMIDGFYREYDFAPEKDTVRYVITKRKVLQSTDVFQEDELQECELGPGKVLISAEIWRDENDPKKEIEDVEFPSFIPHLSAVRYRKGDSSICRGVCLAGGTFPSDSCYVIPLDDKLLKSRDHEKHLGYHWHEHIPGPNIEVLTVEDLTDEEKSDYFAFVQFWKKREQSGLFYHVGNIPIE